MSFKRSTGKAARLVALALLTTVSVSACVGSYTEYYDDEYYPEERTVVVKHTRPIYRRVDVYDTRPTVVYTTRPNSDRYYRHHNNHYYGSTYVAPPSTTSQVVVRKNKHYNGEQTVILNPGQHQQQKVIVRPYGQRQNTTIIKRYPENNQSYNSSTTVVKPYSQTVVKSHHYNKTHDAPPPRSAEVKHSKKIVIESPGDAPPSTLAE